MKKKFNNAFLKPFLPLLANILLLIIYLKLSDGLMQNFEMSYEIAYFITLKLMTVVFFIMSGIFIYLTVKHLGENVYFLIFVLALFITVFSLSYFNNLYLSEQFYKLLCIYLGLALTPYIINRKKSK